MKHILLLIMVFSAFISSVKAQTDTIYRDLTVVQSDSLIQAHIGDTNFVILDVRQIGPYNSGHIANAINIDYYDPNFSSLIAALDHNKIYLVHCQSGGRSAATFAMMQTQHFREVYNMLGGMGAWLAAGYPVVTASEISDNQANEFSATLIFPNPVTDFSFIDISKWNLQSGTIEVYNYSGQLVSKEDITSTRVIINRKDYSIGQYFYLISDKSNLVITGNFHIK